MTIIGWIQIVVFSAFVLALARPLGGYMTRLFNGESTWLSPVLRPVERGLYRLAGIDERQEQTWFSYTIAMLFFHVAGFVILYALLRLQAVLPITRWACRRCLKTSPSTRRRASSPTPTGRTTAARARCRISSRCWG